MGSDVEIFWGCQPKPIYDVATLSKGSGVYKGASEPPVQTFGEISPSMPQGGKSKKGHSLQGTS